MFGIENVVSTPPTHRRGIIKRAHNNNTVNQHFVYIACDFCIRLVFSNFAITTKKAQRRHKEPTYNPQRNHKQKERPCGLSFSICLRVCLFPRYSNPRSGHSDRIVRKGQFLRFAIVNVHRTFTSPPRSRRR